MGVPVLAHAPRVLHESAAEDEEKLNEEVEVEMGTDRHRFDSQTTISRWEVEAARWTPSSAQSSPLESSPWS